MMKVTLTPAARKEFDGLELDAQIQVQKAIDRLEDWPNISGVKALRGDRKGEFRIRTGDYRIIYIVILPNKEVRVVKIGNRRDVYDD